MSQASSPLILIVEDTTSERMRMTAYLSGLGHRCLSVNDGAEALSIMEREQVTLVLSDWRMPVIDGLRLCKQLKKHTKYGRPYFIMLTGHADQEDVIEGMDAGADDYMIKPFISEELRVRVEAGLRRMNMESLQIPPPVEP